MAMARTQGYRPGLVDLASGQISREIFVNDEIYAEEQEKIFARAWLFVGHESQIPNPGDYFVSCMGEESVILCRDRAGKVHVFLNSCRHRGMKVCRYDEGNTTVFTCPYHGWSYRHRREAGRRAVFPRGVSFEARPRAMGPRRGRAAVPLQGRGLGDLGHSGAAVPRISRRRSRAFSICSSTAGTGARAQAEVLGGVQKWRVPCNWKFPAENFSGDTYHNISHRSVDLAGIGPSGSGRRDIGERDVSRKLHVCIPDRGHQTIVYVMPKASTRRPPTRTRRWSPSIFRIAKREAPRCAARGHG